MGYKLPKPKPGFLSEPLITPLSQARPVWFLSALSKVATTWLKFNTPNSICVSRHFYSLSACDKWRFIHISSPHVGLFAMPSLFNPPPSASSTAHLVLDVSIMDGSNDCPSVPVIPAPLAWAQIEAHENQIALASTLARAKTKTQRA